MFDGLRPIKSLFISALETAITRYLLLDEKVELLLAPLAGKVIAINISDFGACIYICPTLDGIQILDVFSGNVDTTLSGSLYALGLMGISAKPMHTLFKGEVKIEGDTAVAHKLQSLFAKLDLDLENKMAAYTGSRFASSVSRLFRSSRDWSQHTLENFRLNLQEFLQEETRELPAQPEAELFFQQIDNCRCDLDRACARIARLTAALENSTIAQSKTGTQP